MSIKIKTKKNHSYFKNSINNNYDKDNNKSSDSISVKNNLKIIELCSSKLLKNPDNKRALLLRASIYIKINKFKEAKNDLQLLLNEQCLASTAYYLLGIIYKETNNNELALIYFTKSIELDDNNINAYFLRGAVNNILGNYKNAIKDYNDAIYKDTLNADGKNIYKNISKIFMQTLNNQKNLHNKKQRKNSLINYRKNNYVLDKFQINYNSEKNKNKGKCISQDHNLKIKNYNKYHNIIKSENNEEDLINMKNLKNNMTNSTSNNFNFFIRNITDKKMNDKYCDTKNLLKEINGYLNEEDNDVKSSFNLQTSNKNEDNYNYRNKNIFHKSISSNEYDALSSINNQNFSSSLITNKTCNTSNEFIKASNKSSSSLNFQNNNNNEKNSKNYINNQKSGFFNHSFLISETGVNNNDISNNQLSNSQNANLNDHIIEQNSNNQNYKINYNMSITNNNNVDNNKSIEKELLTNSPFYESTKTMFDCSNGFNNSNNELNFNIEQKPLFYLSEKKCKNNYDNENLTEEEFFCIKGEIERNKGNYNEAIDSFTKAIQLNPNSFKAFFNRAFTYDKIGLYNKAINDYTSTVNIKPNHSFCYYNRGITYNKLGCYEQSIFDFSRAIEIEPNKPEFYFNRACLYKNAKQYQNAINDYTIVIKLFPKLYTPVYNRGVCYEKLKIYQSSIKDFEKCIDISKNNIHPYYHLATIYKILKKYELSIKYLKLLIDIKSDYSPAYHDIGVILIQLEENEKAIQYFNKSIEIDNKKSIYYHNRGWAYRKINPQNAINDMTMAINLDKNNPRFYFNRASIYKNEKMYDKAIEDYSVVILKFDNKNYDSYINRGLCFYQINNFYDAINDYTKAIELKNDDVDSLWLRADLYMKINKYFLAIEDLNNIIKKEPNNENAYIKRAKCYENIKNIKESCNDYEKALLLSGGKPNYNK